jgi:hypothetical protein
MVSAFLIAAALATTPSPADSGSTGRAEARVSATITHSVTLRGSTATARDTGGVVQAQPPRRCDPAASGTACRMIVLDLP